MITEIALQKIKEIVEIELLKRGFTAPITLGVDTKKIPHIIIDSEPFQTTPVIFKQITIQNFGGSLQKQDDDIVSVWIPINVGYKHFDHGTNGCKLFTFFCDVQNDGVYNINIK